MYRCTSDAITNVVTANSAHPRSGTVSNPGNPSAAAARTTELMAARTRYTTLHGRPAGQPLRDKYQVAVDDNSDSFLTLEISDGPNGVYAEETGDTGILELNFDDDSPGSSWVRV